MKLMTQTLWHGNHSYFLEFSFWISCNVLRDLNTSGTRESTLLWLIWLSSHSFLIQLQAATHSILYNSILFEVVIEPNDLLIVQWPIQAQAESRVTGHQTSFYPRQPSYLMISQSQRPTLALKSTILSSSSAGLVKYSCSLPSSTLTSFCRLYSAGCQPLSTPSSLASPSS